MIGHHHPHHNIQHAVRSHRVLIMVLLCVLLFAIVEAICGWWAHSLALLSDAGHMASDAVALAIAAFAGWIAQKPPSEHHSYGLGRAEVLAAWLSSLLMVIIAIAIIIEAIERIHTPSPVQGAIVAIVAFVGLIVNLWMAWMLARSERSLNIRAALLHIMGDLLGSLAALISGAVIYFSHWTLIDPILSILIGLLILLSSLRLLRESLRVLMEGVPQHIDYNTVLTAMKQFDGVKTIHDFHIWTLSSGKIALSAHVDIHEMSSWPHVLEQLDTLLHKKFNISHITLQPEPAVMDCRPCSVQHDSRRKN